MKWMVNKIKTGFIFGVFFLAACVNTAIAQELPSDEALIVVSCGGGREPEGSFLESQNINVKNSDIIQQIDDVLIVLRNDSLYSIALNSSTDEALEIVSKQKIPNYTEESKAVHLNVLVANDLVIVISELKSNVDFTFYSLNAHGELEYQRRYSFSDEMHEIWSLMSSATVVNNTLVFGGEFIDDYPLSEEFDESFLSKDIIVSSQSANEPKKIDTNITLNRKWVNPWGAFDESGFFTNVFACPLDSLIDGGLMCDITSIVGVDARSVFINDQAVYLWGDNFIGGHYGVMAHSPKDYIERTDLKLKISTDEHQSAIYRIDLNYHDVTAVLTDGRLMNSGSYEENDDVFSALLKKTDGLAINHDLTYGLQFDVSQFSALPVALPESDYQFLGNGAGRIIANRFSEGQIVLSRSIYSSQETDKHELILWDVSSEGVLSIEAEFPLEGLYFYDNNVLAIGRDDDTHGLKMQTWLATDELEPMFISDFDIFSAVVENFDDSFLGSSASQSVFGLPIIRLQDGIDEPAVYINSYGDEESIIDMHYFEISDKGIVTPLGKLLAEPEVIEEDDCEVSCDEWYGVQRPFRSGDYVYSILGDEIIKGAAEQSEVSVISRLNLLVDPDEED